jgi:hypothetical protein
MAKQLDGEMSSQLRRAALSIGSARMTLVRTVSMLTKMIG